MTINRSDGIAGLLYPDAGRCQAYQSGTQPARVVVAVNPEMDTPLQYADRIKSILSNSLRQCMDTVHKTKDSHMTDGDLCRCHRQRL